MRITAIGLLLAAQWLYGQQTAAQSITKVFYFANTDSPQEMQEINNTIRPSRVFPPLWIRRSGLSK